MHSPRVVVIVIYGLISTASIASGQETTAECSAPGSGWSFNSLLQSPCLVTAYLASPCASNGDYVVSSLNSTNFYLPSNHGDICECNSVVYSLFSACAACQNALIGSWSVYRLTCSTVDGMDGHYPMQVPAGTAIPRWAYQQVFGTNRFNVTLAQAVGDMPENSSTSSTSSSSSMTQTINPPASGDEKPSDTAGHHTGAIVGGVIAGVGALIIGACLIFFLLHRKNGSWDRFKMHRKPSGTGGFDTIHTQTAASIVSPKHYDPDDPSTFPPPRSPQPHDPNRARNFP